jgi:hypothetical protein
MKKNGLLTSRLKELLIWLDGHILLVLSSFLIAFIPLYPKIPLAELIPGYIVRMRLEDIFIAFTAGVWAVQLLRKKARLRSPLTLIMGMYFVFSLFTMVFAVYWTRSVPPSQIHILKMVLHWMRRIEYFSLFYIVYSSIKKREDVFVLLRVFIITALLVSLYGMGQKYFYWPLFSTMNREFSKGVLLYLTPHARVQSTFGGHYDYAAYLVMALPLSLALAFYTNRRKSKVILWVTFLVGLWGLMMTSSFLAYLFSITVMFFLYIWQKGFLWSVSRLFVVYTLSFSFMFLFGDLSERFAQIYQGSSYEEIANVMNKVRSSVQAPMVEPPKGGVAVDDAESVAKEAAKKDQTVKIILDSDARPTDTPPNASLPPDVHEDIPDQIIATKSAEGKDIQVVIPRVFSENAHKLGLSAAIRLDTLWPFALKGFLRNPLFGSGYGTLNKYTWGQFTEAESTDNDFLRTLGETGLLGFLTFYGTMVVAITIALKYAWRTKDELLRLLAIVLLSVTLGLFINAVYIDVFVASKVIQTYWALVGIILGYVLLVRKNHEKNQ